MLWLDDLTEDPLKVQLWYMTVHQLSYRPWNWKLTWNTVLKTLAQNTDNHTVNVDLHLWTFFRSDSIHSDTHTVHLQYYVWVDSKMALKYTWSPNSGHDISIKIQLHVVLSTA